MGEAVDAGLVFECGGVGVALAQVAFVAVGAIFEGEMEGLAGGAWCGGAAVCRRLRVVAPDGDGRSRRCAACTFCPVGDAIVIPAGSCYGGGDVAWFRVGKAAGRGDESVCGFVLVVGTVRGDATVQSQFRASSV